LFLDCLAVRCEWNDGSKRRELDRCAVEKPERGRQSLLRLDERANLLLTGHRRSPDCAFSVERRIRPQGVDA